MEAMGYEAGTPEVEIGRGAKMVERLCYISFRAQIELHGCNPERVAKYVPQGETFLEMYREELAKRAALAGSVA